MDRRDRVCHRVALNRVVRGSLSEKMKEDTFDYLKRIHSWVCYKGKGLNLLLL